MTSNLQHIINIVESIEIDSQKQVLLNGSLYEKEFSDEYLDKPGNKMIFETIHRLIYREFYTKRKGNSHKGSITEDEISAAVKKLSDANPSSDRFDEGWYIEDIDSMGNSIAVKGELKRSFRPGEFLTANGVYQPAQKGSRIRLFMPKGMKEPQPVFYYMYGETAGEEMGSDLVRVYFNFLFEGNCLLLNRLGNQLNGFSVPFIFKCLCHPALYTRADSAVLYFNKSCSSIVFSVIEKIYSSLKDYTVDEVPLFTLVMGKGISFAETPPRLNESFGTHLSKIIAAGIMNGYESGVQKGEWLQRVLHHIQDNHGYADLEKLYLNPGSKYPYQFRYYE